MARPKRDPLIAAMIAKLPEAGPWPVESQKAWLDLMAMAFATVYGGSLNQIITAALDAKYPRTLPLPKPKPAYPFYIDEQGHARKQDGSPIKAKDVKGEIFDLRGEHGDMKTIQWADGSSGLNGADLTIVAV